MGGGQEWVRERFMEIFDLYLAEELGCPPNIYIDDKIAEGMLGLMTWHAPCTIKVLVA